MQIAQRGGQTWRFPRLLLEDQIWFGLFVAAGTFVFSTMVAIGVSFFRDISVSAWEIASGAAPWFVAGISGWIMFSVMPLFVANGRTRRDCLIEWSIFLPIHAGWMALLVSIGYLLESAVYRIAGWPRQIEDRHMFSSHTDVVPMFGESLVIMLVWAAVGGFIGASLYRSEDVGWLSIIPGAAMVGAIGSFSRSSVGPFGFVTDRLPDLSTSAWPLTILMSIVCLGIAMGGAWLVFRDIPLRSK